MAGNDSGTKRMSRPPECRKQHPWASTGHRELLGLWLSILSPRRELGFCQGLHRERVMSREPTVLP